MALYEALDKSKPTRPPHLRSAGRGKSCATCRYYKAKSVRSGACRLYASYPVSPSQVCDSYRGD